MPLTIVFLFCVKVCRECVKIYYTLRKTKINKDKKPRTTSLATRRSNTELCPFVKKHHILRFLEMEVIRKLNLIYLFIF